MRIYFVIPALLLATHCSAMHARWYGRPEWKYRATSRDKSVQVPVARFASRGADFELWSDSGRSIVCLGPVLVPFWDVEAPLLNQSNVVLNLRIIPREPDFRIEKSSLAVTTDDGRTVLPVSLFLRYRDPDQQGNHLKYYDSDKFQTAPEYIPIRGAVVLEMPNYILKHSRLKWYEMTLRYKSARGTGRGPRIRLSPARDHDYTPFELPIAYPPPR